MVSQISLGNVYQSGGKTVSSGSSSGIDTEALIKALTEAKRQPAVKLETKNKTIDSKTASYNELQSLLAKFQTSLDTLRNPPGVQNASQNIFEYRTSSLTATGSSPASNYMSMSVEPGTAVQSFAINEITQLAQAAKQQSNVFTLASTAASVVTAANAQAAGKFSAGTVTLKAADGGANVQLTLNEGDSLQSVVSKFNEVKGRTGIQANIVKVATNGANSDYQIIFTGTKTGTNYGFDLESSGTVISDATGVFSQMTFDPIQEAKNAKMTIDNVAIERQSNSISDLIEGVTFTLKQETQGAVLNASVTPDTDIVKNALTQFADTYNEFRLFVSKQSQRDESGTPKEDAVLATESLLRTITSQVASEVTRVVSGIVGGDPSRLADIGINFSDFAGDADNPATKNIMTIDTDKLGSALATDFDGIRGLFEFTLKSDNANLAVFKRNNALGISNFTLNIDRTNGTYTATYLDANNNTQTVALDATPISGSGGVSLSGKKGTVLEGLQLLYSAAGDATMNVSITQGMGDRLYNLMDSILNATDGSLTTTLSQMADQEARNKTEITKIDDSVEKYRTQLTDKFASLEAALTKANQLLSLLDAQAQARNASSS